MKKSILLFVLLLCLTGCSTRVYTPVIKDEFTLNAVYETGDFSYTCKIVKTQQAVSVIPTSTAAQGMTIKCDGQTVTFQKDNMVIPFATENTDVTNPAVILYEVFTSLTDAQAAKNGECFEYRDVVGAGGYVLQQNLQGDFTQLDLPSAGIHITFLTEE